MSNVRQHEEPSLLMSQAEVRQASPADLESVARLFDEYRQFQAQPCDLQAARNFLSARLERSESVIFIASVEGGPVGFAQLYPTFSSVSLSRVFILNDLFVSAAARKSGVARALLSTLEAFAWQCQASRVTLNVARSNASAQVLYERGGWVQDQQFFMFHRYPPKFGEGESSVT